jgi:hypothetical protein
MSDCNINTTFKNISSINNDLLLNILESNLKHYLDWAFLNIGAWFDVRISNETIYATNSHYKLLPVEDPSYIDGQVWQGIRKDWVWENGIVYHDSSPIVIGDIYVNGTPIYSGFVIDYPNGRILFDSPISTSSTVSLEYSYRFVQVYRANDAPWLNLLQYSSFRTDSLDIKQTDEGDWSIGNYHRVQMPCIIIESLPRSRSLPYELGSGSLVLEQDIMMYIFTENKNDRNKLLDIIRVQQDSVIYLYDTNRVAQDDNYPLDYNGSLKPGALMYPDLVTNYAWRKCWFKNISLTELSTQHPNLHSGAARITAEIIYA